MEKTDFLTTGTGKSGQQPEKEWNYNIFQHYIQK